MREYAVVWNNTNNLGLVQIPKRCSIVKISATCESDAIESAVIEISNMIVSQFPTFKCMIHHDKCDKFNIYLTDKDEYVGCLYDFKAIS